MPAEAAADKADKLDKPSAPARRKSSARSGGKSGGSKAAKAADKNQGAFRVAVRCRPLLEHERGKESVLTLTSGTVTVHGSDDPERIETPRMPSPRRERSDSAGQRTAKAFSFDHVYDEFCTQEEVYTQFVAPYTAHFLAGYNVTVFAYGQTGTGKTHTVIGSGSAADRGIVPRFVEEVFSHVAAEAGQGAREAQESGGAAHLAELNEADSADAQPLLSETGVDRVGITILEVYESKVFDLLTPERRPVSSGGDKEKLHGTQLQLELEVAPGKATVESRCYWVRGGERTVRSAAEALDALRNSLALRHTASHALNDASSRSHCIFSLQVHRKREVYRLERVDREKWRYVLQPAKTTITATRVPR